MDEITTDLAVADENFDWSDFGKAVAVESTIAFAISAASIAGFLAAGLAVTKISEFNARRKIAKKNATKDTDQD